MKTKKRESLYSLSPFSLRLKSRNEHTSVVNSSKSKGNKIPEEQKRAHFSCRKFPRNADNDCRIRYEKDRVHLKMRCMKSQLCREYRYATRTRQPKPQEISTVLYSPFDWRKPGKPRRRNITKPGEPRRRKSTKLNPGDHPRLRHKRG